MSSTFQNTLPFPFTETQTPEQFLYSCLTTSTLHHAVLIVPTGRYSRLLKQYIAQKIYAEKFPPIAQPVIITLEECIKRLRAVTSDTPVQFINEAFRVALIESAVEKVDLEYFAHKDENKDKKLSRFLLQSLANIIYGLKEDGNTLENFGKDIAQYQQAPESAITNIEKYRDVYKLFEQYEKLLEEGKLADQATILRQVCEVFQKQESSLLISQFWQQAFPECRQMFISGFTEFKRPEITFLSSLLSVSFPVRLTLDYSEKNGPLFGNLHDTGKILREQGFLYRPLEDNTKPDNKQQLPSAFLRRWLFNTEEIKHNENLTDKVHLFEFNSAFDEVQGIVRYVKHLLIKEKYHPSEIALLLPVSEQASLFRELFRYYGIPVNITDRRTLANSTVATEVLLLLNTIVKGWRTEEIRQVMNSRYISRSFTGENSSKYILLNVASKLRIRGGNKQKGLEGWNTRLEKRTLSLDMLIQLGEEAGDTESIEKYQTEKEQIAIAQKTLQEIGGLLSTPPQSCTADEFVSFINTEILQKLELHKAVLEYYTQARLLAAERTSFGISIVEEAEREARSYAALQEALEEYKQIYQIVYKGKKVSFDQHVQRLQTSFVEYKYQSLERQGYGITVTAAEQIRGIPFKVTILCGMNDGIVPRPYVPERFLGKTIENADETFLKQARVLFYQVLTNNAPELDAADSKRKIVLSYATLNNGEKLIPSPFVAALQKLLPSGKKVVHVPTQAVKENDPAFAWYITPVTPDELMKKRVLSTSQPAITTTEEQWKHLQLLYNDRAEQTPLPKQAYDVLSAFGKNAISPSALETYAECPYKFFGKYVLKISETDSADNALSRLEKGNVLHAIVCEFYRELQRQIAAQEPKRVLAEANGIQLIPVRLHRSKEQEYKDLLYKKTEQILQTVQFYHPFFQLDKDELLGTEFAKGTLERWLDDELKRHEQEEDSKNSTKFAPALMEVSFGRAKRNTTAFDAVTLRLADNRELRIKGAVDRVEIAHSDFDSSSFSFRISDYKSGNIDKYKEKENKEKENKNKKDKTNESKKINEPMQYFQMPLYIATVKEILQQQFGIQQATISGGRYYSFKQDAKAKLVDVLTTENREELIQKSIEQAITIQENIANNSFAVQPIKQDSCTYCSYKPMCRITYNTSASEQINEEDNE